MTLWAESSFRPLVPVDEDANAPKHVKQESLDIRDLLAHSKNVIFPPGSESHNEDVSFMKERPPSDLVCHPSRCLQWSSDVPRKFGISVELYVIPLHEDTKVSEVVMLSKRSHS